MTPSQFSQSYYETPYIYSKMVVQFDVSSGATGDYRDVIPSDGDSDFFMRRAVNVKNFLDKNGVSFIQISPSGTQSQATAPGFDMPIAPEKLYPLGASIPFVLDSNSGLLTPSIASLTFSSTTVNIACPTFQGVKRRRGKPDDKPDYAYTEKPYDYPLNFVQDWTFLLSPYTTFQQASPRRFRVQVLNWDFELQAIEVSGDAWNNNTGQNTYNGYMMMLYDANGYSLMRDFVHYRNLSYNGGFVGNTKFAANEPGDTQPWHPNCFPVPPIIYPKGSTINMDIVSLLDTSGTGGGSSINQQIIFRGVNRIPC